MFLVWIVVLCVWCLDGLLMLLIVVGLICILPFFVVCSV